jgi:hypothetical protein
LARSCATCSTSSGCERGLFTLALRKVRAVALVEDAAELFRTARHAVEVQAEGECGNRRRPGTAWRRRLKT